MPYPSTTSLDTFDRADAADLGAAWTGSLWSGETIPEVNANTAYANGGARSAYWNAGTFPEDQEAWIVSNGNRALIDLRVTNPGGALTCYEADFNTTTWSLNRIVAGSGTGAVASGSFTNAAGDVLGVTLIGTLFYVFQNGSVLASGSDPSPVLGAGYLGFEILTAARIREYGGGEITHPRRTAQALIAGAATVVATSARRRVAGPALVASSSTVTAAPGRRKIAGPALVAGASTVTAAVVRRRAVVALVASSSTVTAATARRRAVVALVAGSSTVTVATVRRRGVAVVVSGVSTVTVVRALGGIRAIAPTIGASSTVTAAPRRSRTVAALVASSSTATVAVQRRRGVAVLVGASSTVTVGTAAGRRVAVLVGATATVTAVPSVPVAVLVYFVSPVYP